MQNPNQNQCETQNTQLKIEELRKQNEMMDLAIELAFKEHLYALLKNRDSDPDVLAGYLKMNEKREAQKLKSLVANLKEREIQLKEQLEERRLALEERKQALNEKKFQYETQDLPEEDEHAPEPPLPPAVANKAQPQQKNPSSDPVKSSPAVPRNGTSATHK